MWISLTQGGSLTKILDGNAANVYMTTGTPTETPRLISRVVEQHCREALK